MNSLVSNRASNLKPNFLTSIPNYVLVLIILLSAVFICIPLFNAGFIWYDDDMMVFKNPLMHQFNFDTFKQSFGFENIVHYHPLVYLSFAFENSLFGLDPHFYHLTNIFLHCLNSVLVFYLIIGLRGAKLHAFIIALLFAVHPMHVESVSWITERKDVLYAFFYIISLIFYLKLNKNDNKKYYIYSILFFVLSCLSKSMAVTLPFVLFAIDRYIFDRKITGIKDKIPYLLIAMLFIILNLQTAFYKPDIHIYSIYERISFIFYAVLFYPVKMLFPFDLSIVYAYPVKPGIQYLLSPIVFIITIFLLYKLKIRSNEVKFGLWFYLITIMPVLPIIPFGISLTADRYSYIPLLGLFYIVTYLFLKPGKINIDKKRIFLLSSVSAIVIIIFVILSFNRAGLWINTELLMKDAIAKDQDNDYAYYILGNYYSDNNRLTDAIASYNNCLRIKPANTDAYFNLGNAYFISGDNDNAVRSFLKVVELNPNDKMAYNNLGVVYENSGHIDRAIENYRRSASLGYEPARDVLRHYGYSP